MTERELTFDSLGISREEIYVQMGYGSSMPDATVISETDAIIGQVKGILRPRFCFFVSGGVLHDDADRLGARGEQFDIGRIITRQLRGSQAYAFFVATSGVEFEDFLERIKAENDMVRVFIADALGSVIAEKAADRMEEVLQEEIDARGWKHTNRFSPGYCGWHVSQQQYLFRMFPDKAPCGVRLTASSLMMPIKSVSGVIGVGENVRKLEYSCGLCDYAKCYKRKKKEGRKIIKK